MNKIRRGPAPSEFSQDKRRYESKPEPKTAHTKGTVPGNMMGYAASRSPASYPSLSNESKNYGPKRLSNPTGIDGSKTMPAQMKEYSSVNPIKSEWTQIQSQLNKRGK